MAYKTIQVYLDNSEHDVQRLTLAINMARDMSAELVGLHVMSPLMYPSYVAAEIPAKFIEERQAQIREETDSAINRFNETIATAGVRGEVRRFDPYRSNLTATVAEIGRYADLNIVGQSYPGGTGQAGTDLAEPLLFGSGRPVLVVPYAGHFDVIGRKVMLAWNATRESSRALFDALPILQSADEVSIMTVNPSATAEAGDPLVSANIAHVLARHGVNVTVEHTVGEDISVGDMLLSALADESADMLVMGAYGHSRMREFVFGGATRHILRHMTVPVLLSH